MSRIGKNAVAVPKGVSVDLKGQDLSVKGPKGQLSLTLVDDIVVTHEGDSIKVAPRNDNRRGRSMWGMQRTLVSNMLTGVTQGFTTKLEINGVGYRAAVQGKNLQLALGYSHDVVYAIPEGITIVVPKPTEITITGTDSQRVGQVAAEIHDLRPPDPYKQKGIRYVGEVLKKKAGKAGATGSK